MSATFCCPHCDKSYPKAPSLIGRKVRCSSCKNIFQLHGDGTAIKVLAPGPDADKAKVQAQAAAATAAVTRRQKTQAQKSITSRIEKGRSALRDAAKDAIAAQIDSEQTRSSQPKKKERKKQPGR